MVNSADALIAFDLDGVLYSSEPFLGEAYREAIANVNAAAARLVRARAGDARDPRPRRLAGAGDPRSGSFPTPTRRRCDAPACRDAGGDLRHVARGDGILYPDVAADAARVARARPAARRRIERPHALRRDRPRHLRLSDLFVPRVTADQVGDKTAVLRAYLDRLAVAPRRTVMIGDRASDVEAARAVGCQFIGCDYGHGYRHEIEGAGPLVSRFADLPTVIARQLPSNT